MTLTDTIKSRFETEDISFKQLRWYDIEDLAEDIQMKLEKALTPEKLNEIFGENIKKGFYKNLGKFEDFLTEQVTSIDKHGLARYLRGIDLYVADSIELKGTLENTHSSKFYPSEKTINIIARVGDTFDRPHFDFIMASVNINMISRKVSIHNELFNYKPYKKYYLDDEGRDNRFVYVNYLVADFKDFLNFAPETIPLQKAKKYFEEYNDFKTELDFKTNELRLFVSNGKGDDGLWIAISDKEKEEAAQLYDEIREESCNEEITNDYGVFLTRENLVASDEAEIAYVKDLLERGERKIAIRFAGRECINEVEEILTKELETNEESKTNKKVKKRK